MIAGTLTYINPHQHKVKSIDNLTYLAIISQLANYLNVNKWENYGRLYLNIEVRILNGNYKGKKEGVSFTVPAE